MISCGQISSKRNSFNTLEIISTQPPTINLVTFCFFVLRLNSLKSSSHSEFSMKRTTQEKLKEHLCIDKEKSISKITIAGVGQVGSACAYSIMQQVMPSLININFNPLSTALVVFVPKALTYIFYRELFNFQFKLLRW